MKSLPLLLLLCSTSILLHAQNSKDKKWKLVWEENFNGSQLDNSIWNYEVNDEGGGNHELQYYTARKENSYLENGLLHIKAIKEPYLTRQYTSARITTKGKADFTFGKMEIRAKIPVGRGMWPAIWMMPTDSKFGHWPWSGEIDIMETKGQEPDSLYGTMHFGPAAPNNRYFGSKLVRVTPEGWGDDFHTYAIIWQKNKIEWLVDGVKFHEGTIANVTNLKNVPYPFNERFHFILNMAVGGDFLGNPDDSILPKEFLVDYVKVYQEQ
jgi:beta-glucanase (GH16 family)